MHLCNGLRTLVMVSLLPRVRNCQFIIIYYGPVAAVRQLMATSRLNNCSPHRILPTLHNGMGDALKTASPRPTPNRWLNGTTRVHIANGIMTGSAVLAQLMVLTNRQTDTHTMDPSASENISVPGLIP